MDIEAGHAIFAKYQVHPGQMSQSKRKAGEGAPVVFDRKADCEAKAAMRYNYVNFRSGPPPGNLHLAQRVHRLTR